jgi:hypothetical protein
MVGVSQPKIMEIEKPLDDFAGGSSRPPMPGGWSDFGRPAE